MLLAAYTALLALAMLCKADWRSEGYTILAVPAVHVAKTPQGKATKLTIEVLNREGRAVNYTLVVKKLAPGRAFPVYNTALFVSDGRGARVEVELPREALALSIELYLPGSLSPYRRCLVSLAGASDA